MTISDENKKTILLLIITFAIAAVAFACTFIYM